MGYDLRISGINRESIVDGEGLRFVVFAQGCIHNCPGCHNPETHSLTGGELIPVEELFSMITENPLLDGVTFSGGEPFLQPKPFLELAKMARASGMDVTVYTGYTYEELLIEAKENGDIIKLLEETDVLIDGRFIEEKKDLSLAFRGSENQRIIRLRDGRPQREEQQ
jgi:anaerobic ribonucleoside-triphosphate reductase activating protein